MGAGPLDKLRIVARPVSRQMPVTFWTRRSPGVYCSNGTRLTRTSSAGVRLRAPLCRRALPLAAAQGVFPGWVEPDGAVAPILAEGPETAMGAMFLLELGAYFPEQSTYADSLHKRR